MPGALDRGEDVYLPAIGSAFEGQPRGRTEEITPGWFGRLFIRRVIEASPNTRKGKAPNKIEPPGAQLDAPFLTGSCAAPSPPPAPGGTGSLALQYPPYLRAASIPGSAQAIHKYGAPS